MIEDKQPKENLEKSSGSTFIKYQKIPHPAMPSGYHMIFEDGCTYSLVLLGEGTPQQNTIQHMYDRLGGRYEAILLPNEKTKTGWGDPIRAKSYDELTNLVIAEEPLRSHVSN